MKLRKNIVYLIEKDGEVVGNIEYEIKSPEYAYMSGFAIDSRFQRQGIGREALTQMMKELEHFARIDLVTHPENITAIKLYESFGFSIESRIENYFGDGEPRVKMVWESRKVL